MAKKNRQKKPLKRPKPHPADRAGDSLVARLNNRMLFRLMGIYLGMDFLLGLLIAGGIVFSCYRQVGQIAALVEQRGVPTPQATLWMEAGDYTVSALSRPPEGTPLPVTSGGETPQSKALYTFTRGERRWLFGSWLGSPGEGCALTAELYRGAEPYAVTLHLSGQVSGAVYTARVLLVCQLISLIWNLFQNAGAIKKVLRPIQELTAQAAKAAKVDRTMPPEELRALAGRLDEISAAHLDMRIPEEGAQRELRDLTQSINALLERVNRAYAAQARFVSDASHELRTPIAVIQGYANLLDRWGKDDPDAMQESITAIRAEAASMKGLVEQLLFLARGDNDSLRVEPEPVEVTALAAQVLKEAAMIDENHPYAARWDSPVWVEADPSLLKQALRILTDNAAKYSPAGGNITLRAEESEGWVRLSVTDQGQGIAPADLPHVFDRFYRTDISRARQTGGAGLGLSIARWIAQRHGGWMEVISRVNVGTRFVLALPGVDAERAA